MIALLSLFPGMVLNAAQPQARAVDLPLWLVGHWQIAPRSSPLCGDLVVKRGRDGTLSGAFSGYFKPAGDHWKITGSGGAPLLRIDFGANHVARYRYSRSTRGSIEFLSFDERAQDGIRFVHEDGSDSMRVQLIGANGEGTSYAYRRATAPCAVLPPRPAMGVVPTH